MGRPNFSEATKVGTDSTEGLSRLDEILARHKRRRIRTVAALVLLTVLCGALLAI